MLLKISQFVKKHQEDIVLIIAIFLISLFSFAVGYILAKQQEKMPIKFEQIQNKQIQK